MKNFKRIFFAALIASIAFFNSCKDSGDVGYSILPASDTLRLNYAEYGFADGADLFKITNELDDSVRTDSSHYSLIGVDQSSTFGSTKASSFFSLLPYTSVDTSFRLNEVVDSLVFVLGYKSFTDSTYYRAKQRYYGNFVANTRVQAFLLSSVNAPYNILNTVHATEEPKFDPTVLGETSLVADESETQVRIKFTDSNAQKFGPVLIRNNNPLKYEDFWNAFPGLYLKTNSSSGNIHIFDVTKDTLKLYTHRMITADSTLSHVRDYTWDATRCLNANIYKHDYTASKVNFSPTPSQNDTVYYMQAVGGLKTRLTVGKIKQKLLKNGEQATIYINKATIEIKVDGNLNPSSGLNFFSAFPYLQVYFAGPESSSDPKLRYAMHPISNFVLTTSTYNSFSMNTKGYYEIDVTSPIQTMVTGTQPLSAFYIVSGYRGFTAGRLILSKRNTKLKIVYSKVVTSSK